jgi:multidrug efflux system outer membrane protein
VATQSLSAEQVAARLREQQAQLDADKVLLANAQARARQGVRDLRESLGAKATLLQQRDAATQLQAQALSTDLALIKALGGGYRSADDATFPSSSVNAGASDHERH